MAKLDILHYPDPRLRKRAEPVTNVTDVTRRLIDDLFETMYGASGIGLAATQVDVHQRVLVVDVGDEHPGPRAFINPVIIARHGEAEGQEGCLSVPGYFEPVRRAEHIEVEALDRDGRPFALEADGLLAVCLQHEIDHLDGKLFVDHLPELKHRRMRKRCEKQGHTTRPGAAVPRRGVV